MSLPYTKTVDINIHEGEFKQATTINRIFNRLLSNDQYLENEVKTTAITAQQIRFTPVSAIKHLYDRSYNHTLSTIQGSGTVWGINQYLTLSAPIADIKLDGTGADNKFVTLSAHRSFVEGFRESFIEIDLTTCRQDSLNPYASRPVVKGTQIYPKYPSPETIASDARNFVTKTFVPPANTYIVVLFYTQFDGTRPNNRNGDYQGRIDFYGNAGIISVTDREPPKLARYLYRKGSGTTNWQFIRSSVAGDASRPRIFPDSLG
tara:strand:- start:36829 stop:37614 length:786 start_codon:yes stop_codon:yes gene_type:complete